MSKAMKFFAGIVFTGWVFLWVMLPVNTYSNIWLPKITTATNSTYFGNQGTSMLMMTFPGLLVAIVGSIYVHITKKSAYNVKPKISRQHLQTWKKPFIKKGPLGILSAMELSFCLMFLALIVWSLSIYITNDFPAATKEAAKAKGITVWQMKLRFVAYRFGLVGNLCCAFLFFPVARASTFLPLIGLTSESSIKYHVWLGHIVMTLFTAHGLCYVVGWIFSHKLYLMLKWGTDGVAILAGEIALVSGLFMWITALPRIRRKAFELFYYTHHLYIIFLVFYLLHIGISFYCYNLPGIYLFIIDRWLRFLQSRRCVSLISARLTPETIELNFSKNPGFSYMPLSIIFVNIPSVSSLQWHPFSVSSSSNFEPGTLSVIIKKEGSWTRKLYEKLNQTSLDRLAVSVEGPYGPASIDFLKHDSLVMVSGGSGITPFISIIRELIYRSSTYKTPTPRVLLVCSFKTSTDLTMLDLLLPNGTNVSELSNLRLRIEAFVTREKEPNLDVEKSIQTVQFKPSPLDSCLSPVLGPNGWLWLSAIIASSFVLYLVVIGVITRFYIYPIESSGGEVSRTYGALINLLGICVCIAATSSVAVLANKKSSCMESRQVPVFDDEMELESLPLDSLERSRTVTYGKRPDLEKMITEMEGKSVGVMASGPSVLRRQVAAICSSVEVDNLHFESISFSW